MNNWIKNAILQTHNRVFSNLYLQGPQYRGSSHTVTKVANFYDREVWSFLYLVILQMSTLGPQNSLRKYFKIVTSLIFNRHTNVAFRGGLEGNKNNKEVWNFVPFIKLYSYIISEIKCISTFLTSFIYLLVASFPLSMTYIDRWATQLSLVPLLNVFSIIGTYSYTKYLRTVCINTVASKPGN